MTETKENTQISIEVTDTELFKAMGAVCLASKELLAAYDKDFPTFRDVMPKKQALRDSLKTLDEICNKRHVSFVETNK